MRRVLAQVKKELIQIRRDRLALALALLLPLILLLLLSNAIALTVNNLPIVVKDYDDTPLSRQFIESFRNSITFHIRPWDVNRAPEEALTSYSARGVLIIPEHFGRDLLRGRTSTAQMLVDATDANTAKLLQGYSAQITRAFSQRVLGQADTLPVTAQIRLWYNPGRESRKFYAPGMFVLGISMFPPLLAALAMAKETDQKTILQVYVSSISAHEFVLGKVLAFGLIALAEAAVSLTALFTVFGLRFAGDPTPLLVATVLYAFCVASFGTMIGVAVPNQAAAIQAVALGGFLLVFLLSGLIFPVSNIPPGLRWISNIVWGRYYMEIVRDALLQGGGWPARWFGVVTIAGLGGLFFTVAWAKMRRMQVNA